MSAPTERHETRALLRAHLAAASGYRHLTQRCPICHRLLRLAMEPLTAPQAPYAPEESGNPAEPPHSPETATGAPGADAGAAPLPHRTPPARDGTGADHPEAPLGAPPEARPGDEGPRAR
ncbi:MULTISPECIES: DUF6274 family protein [unclassified Streptomyces]|uniref:DUF6274 family protein n=1 Tax=unclassified Streptomyces TaxID=2593676 RepID=UPI0015E16FF1|nr:DUF6274 family protein [Streptomyces sp. SM10]